MMDLQLAPVKGVSVETPAPARLVRYAFVIMPNAAVCADCGATIPARAGSYRRIDRDEDYPVVCRPFAHEAPEGRS